MEIQDFLWSEKYRPHKIEDCILPPKMKQIFAKLVAGGNIPNMTLSGSAGTGKTTVARAMLDELGADYIVVNGSLEGRSIDILRTNIRDFAGTVSFTGNRKYVILDEADYLNPQSVQPALRNFIEEYSSNCGFILTCNFKNKILDPIRSRCPVIEFKVQKEDKENSCKELFLRLQDILKGEGIEYDKKALAALIMVNFPDFRKTINILQRYAASGKIDEGVLATTNEESFGKLVGFLKNKDFPGMRKWIAQNTDMDFDSLVRTFYDNVVDLLTPAAVPQFIITAAEYQYKNAFVANPEINTAAFFLEIMLNCEFR